MLKNIYYLIGIEQGNDFLTSSLILPAKTENKDYITRGFKLRIIIISTI